MINAPFVAKIAFMDFQRLINQKIILKDGSKSIIEDVTPTNKIDDVFISLDNGKKLKLRFVLEKEIIRFADKDIQNELLSLINVHLEQEATKNSEIEEAYQSAVASNKQKAINELKDKVVHPTYHRTKQYPNVIKGNNVAYKATYCDGNGDWFKAPCSINCRRYNCSSYGGFFCKTNSLCKEVLDGKKDESIIQDQYSSGFLCYESRLLIDYTIYAGRTGHDEPKGWSLGSKKLVVLTTIKPGYGEIDRVIFGAFLVERAFDKTLEKEAHAVAYQEYRIALTEEESEQMKYWDYAPGDNGARPIQWTENLTRKRTDDECASILYDLVNIIKNRNNKEESAKAEAFLNKYLELIHRTVEDIKPKNGARLQYLKNR